MVALRSVRITCVLILVIHVLAAPLAAQNRPAAEPRTLDERLFYGLYSIDDVITEGYFRGIRLTAYPLFLAVPVIFIVHGSLAERYRPAVEVVSAAILTYGSVQLTKQLVHRERPYSLYDDIEPRFSDNPEKDPLGDSFPSGHTAMAAAIGLSAALVTENMLVGSAAVAWTGSMALSRIWMGEHHPSDVLAGAAFGIGAALAARGIADQIAVLPLHNLSYYGSGIAVRFRCC